MIRGSKFVRRKPVKEGARRLTGRDLFRAGMFLVTEPGHTKRVRRSARESSLLPLIYSLDIPDKYQRMDPGLIRLSPDACEPLIGVLL